MNYQNNATTLTSMMGKQPNQSNEQKNLGVMPMVVKSTPSGERTSDIFSCLLSERTIFVTGEVNDQMADSVVAQLLYLESEDANKDVFMYINSGGGSISAGMAIFDTMNFIKPKVNTIVMGMAASMGAFLLSGGEKGKRYSLPHSKIMIHQPLGGFQGQASDFEIHANEIIKTKKLMNTLIAEQTGQPFEIIERDTDRDNYMTAQEAKDYGLIDEIMTKRP